MLFWPVRLALHVVALIVLAIVVYFAVTLVQVWLTSRQYDPHPAGAILVMGAAEYDGTPTNDLKSRLDEALKLYRQGYAHLIVVTGGRRPGDVYTEAEVGKMYLVGQGVPPADILEAGGNDSYQNIADATPELKAHGVHEILVTTDPFHEYRSMAIASDQGFAPSPTADAGLADLGLVDRALFREGDGGGGVRPCHRLRPPGVAARRVSGQSVVVVAGETWNSISAAVPWPWAVSTPIKQMSAVGASVAVRDDGDDHLGSGGKGPTWKASRRSRRSGRCPWWLPGAPGGGSAPG